MNDEQNNINVSEWPASHPYAGSNLGSTPPPPPPRKKKRTGLKIAGGIVAGIIVISIIASATGGSSDKKSDDKTTAVVTQQHATASATPTSKPKPKPDTVEYIVTGSPADVTYGPSGSSLSGHSGMHVTKKLGSPSYYSISAQLTGSGKVTCEIKVKGKVVSKGTATGSYNIAMCEIVKDPFGGSWQDANSN